MTRWRAQGKQVLQDGKHFADAVGDLEAMMIVNALRALDERASSSPTLADAAAYGFDFARSGSDRTVEVEYRDGEIIAMRDVEHPSDTPRIGNVIRDAVMARRPHLNLNSCRAYQASDQMICPCGLQWDMNDPDPPRCVHRSGGS